MNREFKFLGSKEKRSFKLLWEERKIFRSKNFGTFGVSNYLKNSFGQKLIIFFFNVWLWWLSIDCVALELFTKACSFILL